METSLKVVPADEGSGQGEQRLVDVGPALVANCQSTEAAELRERPFDHPAVPAEAVAAFHPTPGDPAFDVPLAQSLPAAR
jgi:hypothetical protein